MSVGHEATRTFLEMRDIITDSDFDGTASPFIGAYVGISGGVAFMIAVEGIGRDSSYRIQPLQNQINGLEQAKSELAGANPVLAARRESISQAIAHKRVEIRQATPEHHSLGQAVVKVGGPLAGGMALGIFAGAALAARLRIRRQNRSLSTYPTNP